MSSFINVDHSKLEGGADSIQAYLEKYKAKMSLASDTVNHLRNGWQGRDFMEFQRQWDKQMREGAVSYEMIKVLGSYADFLRYAAKLYKETQAKTVTNAKNI